MITLSVSPNAVYLWWWEPRDRTCQLEHTFPCDLRTSKGKFEFTHGIVTVAKVLKELGFVIQLVELPKLDRSSGTYLRECYEVQAAALEVLNCFFDDIPQRAAHKLHSPENAYALLTTSCRKANDSTANFWDSLFYGTILNARTKTLEARRIAKEAA